MARTKAEGGISGLQKAAILLISLGPERSAGIFKHLKEEEIEELNPGNRQYQKCDSSGQRRSDQTNFTKCVWHSSISQRVVSVMQKSFLTRLLDRKKHRSYLQADCFLTGPPIRVRAEDRSESAFELYPG